MADAVDETSGWTSDKWTEFVATLLLAVAALSTAWSGYQGALWDGNQSSSYSQAGAARTEAAQKLSEANQFLLADLSVFENWATAWVDGDTPVREFYESRFRPEFVPAFEAWMATGPRTNPDAPPSPFAMPEYKPASGVEAARLTARADEEFKAGERANTISDIYVLATLFFAMVLFFAAISERLEYRVFRLTLLGIAVASLVLGLVTALGEPITSIG